MNTISLTFCSQVNSLADCQYQVTFCMRDQPNTDICVCVTDQYANFVYSQPEYAEVTANSPMLALDCEMVDLLHLCCLHAQFIWLPCEINFYTAGKISPTLFLQCTLAD